MSLADLISVIVSLSGAPSVTRQGFGTPALVAYFSPTNHWQGTYDKVRTYPTSSVLTDLVADGFSAEGPIYRAFEVAASQSPAPDNVVLARRALAPTQVLKLTLTSTNAGDVYKVTIVGTDGVSLSYSMVSTGVPATDCATFAALITAQTPSGSAASLTYSAGVVTLTGGSGFSAADVGENITISNSTTAANNGTFAVATDVSSSSVTFANPNGAADSSGAVAWYVGAKIGTVTHSGSVITITQAAGSLTDLQSWSSFFQVSNTTTDPGVATDLTAILGANSLGWYTFSLDSNSAAEIEGAQAWAEATGQGGKVAFYDNADSADVTSVTTDVFSSLQARSYKRCYVQFSGSQLLSWGGFAAAAIVTGFNAPGSYALSYKTEVGVLADTAQTLTETQQLILNSASVGSGGGTGGKNGNWYQTVAGNNIAFPGVSPSGLWIDTTIFMDWLQINAQADVFAAMLGLPKVPFTDPGIQVIVQALKNRLKIGAAAPYNGIDPTSISVDYPAANSVDITDVTNRNLPGISASAVLTGAVNTVPIQIVVSN